MKLRQYQIDIKAEARSLMLSGEKSMVIVAPTGSGKTALTASMLSDASRRGMPSWFINHRRELIKQSSATFAKFDVHHGIVAASFPMDTQRLIQICSIGTLANRHTAIRPPKLIIWDECHHTAATTWERIMLTYPDAFHVGLTATPERLDGKGLRKYFKNMINGPSVSWLIENGFLAKYKAYAPGTVSVEGIRKVGGDFVKSELAVVMDKPTITGSNITEYDRHGRGKRNVIFAVNIEHSKHIVAQYNAAGIRAEHVDGTTQSSDRDASLRRFASGETLVLANVDLFGEGFDLPEIEVLSMLRPSNSLSMVRQQMGRVLRPAPGKDHAIILDHVGNIERHGLPDDEIQWSLDGKAGRPSASAGGAAVRICPKCYAAQFAGKAICGSCGFTYPIKARVIEEAEGELVEIDPTVIRRQKSMEQASAGTLEDLIELGRKRGMKKPEGWARHVFMARQQKKLRGI